LTKGGYSKNIKNMEEKENKPKFKINPLAEGYHFCLGCLAGHDKKVSWKTNLIHFVISVCLIIVAPSIFTFINGKGLDEIRNKSPYAKYQEGVNYEIGKIDKVISENVSKDELSGGSNLEQKLLVRILNGPKANLTVESTMYSDNADSKQKYTAGNEVIVRREMYKDGSNKEMYLILDKFRVNNLVIIALIFLILILIVAGIRGISAVLGLVFTVIVIIQLLIPQILLGTDLVWLTAGIALLITSTSLYLAHGFNKRTTISMISTVLTILITLFVASWAVDFAFLTGFGSDDAFHLKGNGITNNLNLRGLLLSGIVIGSLGILDDVTTAQAIAIEEISKADPKMTTRELFLSGVRIGQEHIISLINTLALAYVGTSMPLLLSFVTLNFSPIWVILNDQIIAEELVRTIVGSTCLILAIPISTLLAARFLKVSNNPLEKKKFSFGEEVDRV
jgi:uncharacterized membrane protein